MAVKPCKNWREKKFVRSSYVPAINTNADFIKTNKQFGEACERASVKPTKRQASKFRRGYGSAYKNRHKQEEVVA